MGRKKIVQNNINNNTRKKKNLRWMNGWKEAGRLFVSLSSLSIFWNAIFFSFSFSFKNKGDGGGVIIIRICLTLERRRRSCGLLCRSAGAGAAWWMNFGGCLSLSSPPNPRSDCCFFLKWTKDTARRRWEFVVPETGDPIITSTSPLKKLYRCNNRPFQCSNVPMFQEHNEKN